MGGSSADAHTCEDPCTSTSQVLFNEALELFHCSICLELVYKPIVQACGHIFCFWCTFKAMNVRRESQCPVCRRPYKYFPRVCGLLHFALAKVAPEEYERRGREVQSDEEQKQVFSPRFLESPRHHWSPRNWEEGIGLPWQMITFPTTPKSVVASNANALAGNNAHSSTPGSLLPTQSNTAQRDNAYPRTDTGSIQSILTVDDFACSYCNHLLYRPVVLNCGEAFCESCVKETTSKVFCCPSCQAPHPSGSALLCLELHQYLESSFPIDYLNRKLQQLLVNTQSSDRTTADVQNCRANEHPHVGVGCDGCGMFPIEGDRYHCKDCTEKIGFDLCGSCYNSGGSLLGRFNQEHRPNHRMERIKSGVISFDMRNSTIQRRRQQQQTDSDLDDYINSFVD